VRFTTALGPLARRTNVRARARAFYPLVARSSDWSTEDPCRGSTGCSRFPTSRPSGRGSTEGTRGGERDDALEGDRLVGDGEIVLNGLALVDLEVLLRGGRAGRKGGPAEIAVHADEGAHPGIQVTAIAGGGRGVVPRFAYDHLAVHRILIRDQLFVGPVRPLRGRSRAMAGSSSIRRACA